MDYENMVNSAKGEASSDQIKSERFLLIPNITNAFIDDENRKLTKIYIEKNGISFVNSETVSDDIKSEDIQTVKELGSKSTSINSGLLHN